MSALNKKPFRVNSWYNPEDSCRGEVWYNGKDGYNIYIDDNYKDCVYIHDIEAGNLLAVGSACALGYKLTMKKEWNAKDISPEYRRMKR